MASIRHARSCNGLFLGRLARTWNVPSFDTTPRGVPVRGHARCKGTAAMVTGSTTPPLIDQTIPQHFAAVVDRHGDRPAVHSFHQQTTLTYHALDRRSNALARGLERRGVQKGDRVAVSLGNSIQYAVATYACFKLGAILVPLNPGFTAEQVGAGLRHLDTAHLIIGAETNLPRRKPRSNVDLLQTIGLDFREKTASSSVVPSLRNVVLVDNSAGRVDVDRIKCAVPYRQIEEDGGSGEEALSRTLHPDEVINIQFTSGTTSMPKAASLMHRGILNNGFFIGERMLLTPEDVVCCPPPLFHCFGSILGYMATATHGSAIVFPSEAFDPLATLKAVQHHRCTALYGVPTMFIAQLELLASGAVPRQGFEQLRTGIAAGSSVPAELMRKLHRELNLTQLTNCYGMTETSPVSNMTTTDDPVEKRIGTVGRPLPHVTVKVVDPADKRTVLDVGQRGEVSVAGYHVMKEYWGDRQKTDESIVADESGTRWMLTGDEGVIDQDGYLSITGRIKEIIIRGGENIHPLDIENCLLEHAAVENVSCTGVPDERYGEVVAVFVVRRRDSSVSEQDLKEWVRDRLAKHFGGFRLFFQILFHFFIQRKTNGSKVPKYVFWSDDFPKTPSGKIQRFKLRDEAMERLQKVSS